MSFIFIGIMIAVPFVAILALPLMIWFLIDTLGEAKKRRPVTVTIDPAGMRFGSTMLAHGEIAGLSWAAKKGPEAVAVSSTVAGRNAQATQEANDSISFGLFVRRKNSSERVRVAFGLTEDVANDLMNDMVEDLDRAGA